MYGLVQCDIKGQPLNTIRLCEPNFICPGHQLILKPGYIDLPSLRAGYLSDSNNDMNVELALEEPVVVSYMMVVSFEDLTTE